MNYSITVILISYTFNDKGWLLLPQYIYNQNKLERRIKRPHEHYIYCPHPLEGSFLTSTRPRIMMNLRDEVSINI